MNIPREIYLNQLIEREWNGLVKIVTGVRRCGKSYLLFNLFREHLISRGIGEDQIIEAHMDFASFEDFRESKKLVSYVKERAVSKEKKYYVLIDEIQFVPRFENALNEIMSMGNVDTYVTGSNSKLLSKDISTEMAGRGDVVHLRPLSFAEFFSVYDGTKYDALKEYMEYGGLPGLVNLQSDDQKSKYLKMTVDTAYIRDVVERNKIRLCGCIDSLTNVLFSSIGSLTNIARITKTMNEKGNKINRVTVGKYVDNLCDAFLFEESMRYDVKGKAYIYHLSKYYSVDVGIRNARIEFRQIDDYGHMMENMIYNELRTRGFDVDVGVVTRRVSKEYLNIDPSLDDGGPNEIKVEKITEEHYEIDFVARKRNRRYYIQSAYLLDSEEKMEKETRPLMLVRDCFKKIIVVGSDVPPHVNENGIAIISIYDFLLDPDSLEKA